MPKQKAMNPDILQRQELRQKAWIVPKWIKMTFICMKVFTVMTSQNVWPFAQQDPIVKGVKESLVQPEPIPLQKGLSAVNIVDRAFIVQKGQLWQQSVPKDIIVPILIRLNRFLVLLERILWQEVLSVRPVQKGIIVQGHQTRFLAKGRVKKLLAQRIIQR